MGKPYDYEKVKDQEKKIKGELLDTINRNKSRRLESIENEKSMNTISSEGDFLDRLMQKNKDRQNKAFGDSINRIQAYQNSYVKVNQGNQTFTNPLLTNEEKEMMAERIAANQ